MKQCKSQGNIIMVGDFNAEVQQGKQENIIESYVLGTENEKEEYLVE